MDTMVRVPVIKACDYVVIGGGLRETAAALFLAKQGKQVLMLVRETCLCGDLCGAGRFSFFCEGLRKEPLAEDIFSRKAGLYSENLAVLHPDEFKLSLERMCDRYGIDLLYQVGFVDWDSCGERGYRGLVRIGGKSGIQGIYCNEVLDISDRGEGADWDSYCIHVIGCPVWKKGEMVRLFRHGEIEMMPGAFDDSHGILRVRVHGKRELSGAEYLCQCRETALEAVDWLRGEAGFGGIVPGYFAIHGFCSKRVPLEEICLGKAAAQKLLNGEPAGAAGSKMGDRKGVDVSRRLAAHNPLLDHRGYDTAEGKAFPVMLHEGYDLVIAGSGTAGAMAAIHGAAGGAKTVLLDMNGDLGGTACAGGVSTYWFGRRFEEVREMDAAMEELYTRYGMEKKPGIFGEQDEFHPGIRSMVLTDFCTSYGVEIINQALVVGAVLDQNQDRERVLGVLVLRADGMHLYLGRLTADATGDGDLASFAGAGAVYGSKRDYITYWASLAQYVTPGQYRNNFSSTLMVADAVDYTRFIRIGRKRGGRIFDHGSYVAPRESRHIKGQYCITLKDIVSFREYEDGIYTCFSNYDPKGRLTADMVYGGVLPIQAPIQVPLRALLPIREDGKKLEGIVVLGKAISCTHDAFPSLRMQPDLMHQGAVIGALAARAVKLGGNLWDMDSRERRCFISGYTKDPLTLPEKKLQAAEAARRIGPESRTHWVDMEFTGEVTEEADSIKVMTAGPEEVLPVLEQRYRDSEDASVRVCLAGYMLWHGSDLGTAELLEDIRRELLREGELPSRKGSVMCAQLLPDHGVMPELVYKMNLLAWSKAGGTAEPFKMVLTKLKGYPRDYEDNRKGIYHYIEAFAYTAERNGQEAMKPLLLELLELPELKACLMGEQQAELMTERYCILMLSLYRALARLGAVEGYLGLTKILGLDSLPLVLSAGRELSELTGKIFGTDAAAWRHYIEEQKASFVKQCLQDKIW